MLVAKNNWKTPTVWVVVGEKSNPLRRLQKLDLIDRLSNSEFSKL